jgi:hypothetical protein
VAGRRLIPCAPKMTKSQVILASFGLLAVCSVVHDADDILHRLQPVRQLVCPQIVSTDLDGLRLLAEWH